MKRAGAVAMAVLALAAPSAAMAADAMMVDTKAIAMATSHWDGAYGGVGVIGEISATGTGETVVGLQGILGFNKAMDNFLVGGEVYVMPWSSSLAGLGASLGGEVRGGLLASEQVLLYGALGGEITNAGGTYATFGGGLEFAATEDMSIDLEYKYYWGLNNANRYHHLGLSANWHF